MVPFGQVQHRHAYADEGTEIPPLAVSAPAFAPCPHQAGRRYGPPSFPTRPGGARRALSHVEFRLNA